MGWVGGYLYDHGYTTRGGAGGHVIGVLQPISIAGLEGGREVRAQTHARLR